MKSSNFLAVVSVLCVKINSVQSHEFLPVVFNFLKTRQISSVNAFLCGHVDGDRTMLHSIRENYRRNLMNARVISNLDDLPNMSGSGAHRVGIILDMNCNSSWNLLKTVSDNLQMNTSYVYALIFDVPVKTALKQLEPFNVQFDSDITVFTRHFEIYDLFRTSIARPVTAVKCGGWNEEGEITYSNPPRWDLDGVTINATTVMKDYKLEKHGIEKFFDSQFHPDLDTLSRFAVIANKYLEPLCNFKTNLTAVGDWGYLLTETGKYEPPSSMFRWLQEGKIDLGLTLCRQFSSRLSDSLWSPSTRRVQTSVLFRHPPAGATYDGFARPFSSMTWLVTFLFIFVSSLVLKAIRHRHVTDEPPNEPEYTYSLFSVFAVLALQGSYLDSLRIPTRVLSVILHFFGLMVYSYYGAEIVGFLLSPSPRTLTTVEKLVDSPLDCWVENVSYHLNHFQSRVDAKATKYYDLAIKGKGPRGKDKIMDREKAMKNVKKGKFAVYGSNTEMFQIIQSTFTTPEICSIYIMDMLFVPVSVAIRKKSPYREIYNKALSRFLESGFRVYEDKKWHTPRPPCYGSEDAAPVALEATLIAQMIFVGGFLLSILCFVVEKVVGNNKYMGRSVRKKLLARCTELSSGESSRHT